MKLRSIIIFLIIVLVPFVIGISLFIAERSEATHQKTHFIADTRKSGESRLVFLS